MVCGALVPLSGGRIELTALTVQGKIRRAGFHLPAPTSTSPAVFLQFKSYKFKSSASHRAVKGPGGGSQQSTVGRLDMH